MSSDPMEQDDGIDGCEFDDSDPYSMEEGIYYLSIILII